MSEQALARRKYKQRVDWRQVERTCGTCGAVFFLRPAVVKPINYCSRACAAKARVGIPKSEAQRQKQSATLAGRPMPSTAETNRQRVWEKHPRWRGDAVTKTIARHRAIRHFPALPCEVCGEQPIPGTRNIHRHHKDQNPRNNDPSNIAFLCRRHHRELHDRLLEASK
jgi:hypothetical protein